MILRRNDVGVTAVVPAVAIGIQLGNETLLAIETLTAAAARAALPCLGVICRVVGLAAWNYRLSYRVYLSLHSEGLFGNTQKTAASDCGRASAVGGMFQQFIGRFR